MARSNPQVDLLRRENDLLRKQIERMHQDPPDAPFVACDNSCIVVKNTGQGTNGGCRCDERKLRRAVMYWRSVAQHRQVTIQDMRGRPDVESAARHVVDVIQRLVTDLPDDAILPAELAFAVATLAAAVPSPSEEKDKNRP